MRTALITGVSGHVLTDDERAFYRDVRPAGAILFTRNCHDLAQVASLVASIREAAGADDFLVLIDQEGGRVQRLRGELGRALPPGRAYGDMYTVDPERAKMAAYLVARLTAQDLRAIGIDTNCAPVLDVPVPGAHDIIGDRAYGIEPASVIALGREVMKGYAAGGVVPIIKHIPGHGRAGADSHLALPVVDTSREELSRTDFLPFRALCDAPSAMTAHVVFSAIDAEKPASTSRRVIDEVIRGEIGFGGLLMSDDLSMHALSGPMRQRAEEVLAAGCDVALHCNGDMLEMMAAAEGSAQLSGRAAERFTRAWRVTQRQADFDAQEAVEMLAELLRGGSRTAQGIESV
jgi:beta-N-acetylhexosaminidase